MKTYTLHDGSKITVEDDRTISDEYLKYPREKANRLVAERQKGKPCKE